MTVNKNILFLYTNFFVEWRYFHGGDLARIQTLMKYGGIYLDNDVYVIQNLDKYRRYECAINWGQGEPALGTQVYFFK